MVSETMRATYSPTTPMARRVIPPKKVTIRTSVAKPGTPTDPNNARIK